MGMFDKTFVGAPFFSMKPSIRPDYVDIWQKRGLSYNKANTLFPDAREAERSLLIRGLKIRPGQTLLDVSSGGGYLPAKVRDLFGKKVKILAIEPSNVFGAAIPSFIKRVPGSAATRFKLADESVDRVSNLSGLHHTEKVPLFFSESYRVLRPGGIVGVAEVRKGSAVDKWLNVFVHRHNPHGHEGVFFKPGGLSTMAAAAGFRGVSERPVAYTWNFESTKEMTLFCRILFGLDLASEDKTEAAIKKILGVAVSAGGRVKMRWELLHLFGTK